MIKSEKQKTRTKKLIEDFKKELAEKEAKLANLDNKETYLSSYRVIINDLENEIKEYEMLKAGNFVLPQNITFIELLKNLAKIRISKGLSQQDLARLIGVTKQQINRYEEHDYQNVGVDKVNQILEALNIYLDMKSKEVA
jgi:HTH-type transcriptional regulator / antitoxin HigA